MEIKVQKIRSLVQVIFLILLIVGLFMKLKILLIILLPISIFAGNFFCGWVCPYGSMQELFSKLGNIIFKKKFKMPKFIQKYLQYSRYLIMLLTLLELINLFYKHINAYKSFFGLWTDGIVYSLAFVIMVSFLLISMLFERPFCNYLCTESVKYGVLSLLRIFTIKRDRNTCVDCKKCDKACPMNIKISDKDEIRNGQCINCFECISACPLNKTLSYGKVKIPFFRKKELEKKNER